MTAALARSLPKLDFETYLEIEANDSIRHEYWNGLVYAMAGSTLNHSSIATTAANVFGNLLSSKPCFITGSDLKIETPDSKAAFYPALSIHCNQKPSGKSITAKSPTLVLEILSPSTRDADQTWPKAPQIFTDPKSLIPLTALKIKVKLKDFYHQTDLLA